MMGESKSRGRVQSRSADCMSQNSCRVCPRTTMFVGFAGHMRALNAQSTHHLERSGVSRMSIRSIVSMGKGSRTGRTQYTAYTYGISKAVITEVVPPLVVYNWLQNQVVSTQHDHQSHWCSTYTAGSSVNKGIHSLGGLSPFHSSGIAHPGSAASASASVWYCIPPSSDMTTIKCLSSSYAAQYGYSLVSTPAATSLAMFTVFKRFPPEMGYPRALDIACVFSTSKVTPTTY